MQMGLNTFMINVCIDRFSYLCYTCIYIYAFLKTGKTALHYIHCGLPVLYFTECSSDICAFKVWM